MSYGKSYLHLILLIFLYLAKQVLSVDFGLLDFELKILEGKSWEFIAHCLNRWCGLEKLSQTAESHFVL